MAKLKTQDLILQVALILFNEKGERAVTGVEIAHEMNISPGNLYYHFKGKEEIVEALYSYYHGSLRLVMDNISSTSQVEAKSMLAYLGLIWDIFYQYRFISQDSVNLCAHYPAIKPQLNKALARLHQQIHTLIKKFPASEVFQAFPDAPILLTDNLLNTLLHGYGQEKAASAETNKMAIRARIIDRLALQLIPFLDPQA